MLPEIKMPEPPYEITYDFGISNSLSDIDNPVKLFTDILQKKYGFNDRNVDKLTVLKTKVSKGLEYVYFKINQLT
jgi:Holliday junction resolvase RusA-like endonuclease